MRKLAVLAAVTLSLLVSERTTAQCEPPPPDLLAWWPLDEPSGPTAEDVAGDADGTHSGGPAPVAGRVDGALEFDGAASMVSAIPVAPQAHLDLTVDAWIRPETVFGDQTIVAYEEFLWGVLLQGDEVQCVNCSDTTCWAPTTTTANVQPDVWTHVACTWNSTTDEYAILVNGAKLLSSIYNDTGVHPVPAQAPWTIGRSVLTGAEYPFDGAIDEVEIFSRGLSASEVQAIYAAGTDGKCKPPAPTCVGAPSGMVAWWPADGCDAIDVAGDNDGTPVGFPACPVDPQVGDGALGLDGATYFEVPDHPSLNFGLGDLTIDAWIRTLGTGPQTIVSKSPGYRLGLGNGQLGFTICDDSICDFVQSAETANNGSWRHVAATLSRGDEGPATLAVYIDGVQSATHAMTFGNTDFTGPLRIGGDPPAGYFSGALDEIEVFSRALAPAEIQALYEAGRAGKCRILSSPHVPALGGGARLTLGLVLLVVACATLLAQRTRRRIPKPW